jgi:hypothetical protein
VSLFDWWINLPEPLGRHIPTVAKITLLLWLLIGVVIAVIPELQTMPPVARALLGAPAALGLLYMVIGVILKMADRVIRLGARIHSKGAN